MRYFFKNNNSDFYESRLEDNPFFWIVTTFGVSILCLIGLLKGFYLGGLVVEVGLISSLVFLCVAGYQYYQARSMLGTNKHIVSYLANYSRVQTIETWLINSRNSTGMVSKSYRVMPKVWLYKDYAQGVPYFFVKMQKLGDKDADDVGKNVISPAFGDSFVVISSSEDRNQDWYCFVCSYLDRNEQWIPNKIDDFSRIDPYSVKLMNNVLVDQTKLPHLAIFGLTGSRKTSLLLTIFEEKIGCADCFFLDGKGELSVFSSFYPKNHFATSEEEVTNLLQKLIKKMQQRQKLINEKVLSSGYLGLTAKDADLKPIYLFIDEFASIRARFAKPKVLDKLILQILMQSRSAGIYVIYASQSPNVEGGLNSQSRAQFGTYILLGSASPETQRMIFDTVAVTGSMASGEGIYLEKIAQMPTPQYFVVPDTYKNHLNDLMIFKDLYLKKVF